MVEYNRRRSSGFAKQILLSKSVYRKIVILGSRGSGKHSLINRFFDRSYDALELNDNFQLVYKNQNLILDIVPITDENHYLNEFKHHVETADFIMLAYEIDNVKSAESALKLYKQLRQIREDKMPLVIMGTKLDLKRVNSPPARFHQIEEVVSIISQIKGAKHFLTSSKYNIGVYEAFEYGLNDVIKTIHTLSMSEYMQKKDSFKSERKSLRRKFCFGFRLKHKRRAVTM